MGVSLQERREGERTGLSGRKSAFIKDVVPCGSDLCESTGSQVDSAVCLPFLPPAPSPSMGEIQN